MDDIAIKTLTFHMSPASLLKAFGGDPFSLGVSNLFELHGHHYRLIKVEEVSAEILLCTAVEA